MAKGQSFGNLHGSVLNASSRVVSFASNVENDQDSKSQHNATYKTAHIKSGGFGYDSLRFWCGWKEENKRHTYRACKIVFWGTTLHPAPPLMHHLKTQLDKFNIDQPTRYKSSTLKPRALSAIFWWHGHSWSNCLLSLKDWLLLLLSTSLFPLPFLSPALPSYYTWSSHPS